MPEIEFIHVGADGKSRHFEPKPAIPATVNGYPVKNAVHLDAKPMTRAGAIIMVERAGHPIHPWVVAAIWRDGAAWDSGWDRGDYCATESEALERYHARARRGS